MPLFYTPDIAGKTYTLSEEESKHCVRVLRLAEGDAVHLTDGRGAWHTARITAAAPKRCEVEVVDTQLDHGRRPYALTMAVAPTKNNDRYEWFLEKATEIGIDRIVPLETARSERRTYKTERGNKLIESAMKQSLQAWHPQLDGLTALAEVVKMPFDGDKFIAHCEESGDKILLRDAVHRGVPTLILIGPEGDFAPEEIRLAREHGFQEISLGNSRLRTETAAIAACLTVAVMNS
jgi:16S rRNA (uracil1498-N3)-methyltransferase